MDETRELKKYIHPHDGLWLILCVFTFFALVYSGYDSRGGFFLGIGLVMGGIPLIIEYFTYFKALRKYNQSRLLLVVANDFNSSKSFMNEHIRLGSKYLFCKNSSKIIPYISISDINVIDWRPDDKVLEVKLTDGKTIKIYVVRGYTFNRYKDEFLEMIQAILEKNKKIRYNATTRSGR